MKTFMELLTQCNVIEIPSYQRDYAQGRPDSQAKAIRENLLTDIKNAVENEHIPPLDLNFIYGVIIENEAQKVFIPIDGQQRLTTLFLLHLYAFDEPSAEAEALFFEGDKCRFSYQTRDTSRDFFAELAKQRYEVFNCSQKTSEYIKNETWFLYSWQFDPSIQSALEVIDQICTIRINKEKLRKAFQEGTRLSFQFTTVYGTNTEKGNSFSSSEIAIEESAHDLYLKLNARGRSLTPFEIFKSEFASKCPDEELKKELVKNLDGKYADYFWNLVTKKSSIFNTDIFNTEPFDKAYIQFFKYFFFSPQWKEQYIADHKEKKEAAGADLQLWIYAVKYTSITAATYRTISNILNYITSTDTPLPEAKQCFEDMVIVEKPSFPKRALFYALCVYFEENTNVSQLENWLRICANLINNSNVEDENDYRRACSSIAELSKYKLNILTAFVHELLKISFFNAEQVEEEKIKAYFMLQNETNRKTILETEEQFPYFEGQIRVFLKYAGNYKLEGTLQVDKLKEASERLKSIIDPTKKFPTKDLARALLGYGDYSVRISKYKTLCVVDSHDKQHTPSFKNLFSAYGPEIEALLKSREDLDTLVENAKKNISDQTDWRYCFIHYPDLFDTGFEKRKMLEKAKDRWLINHSQSSTNDTSLYLKTLQQMMHPDFQLIFIAQENHNPGKKNLCLQMTIEPSQSIINIEFNQDHFQITDIAGGKEYSVSGPTLLTDCIKQLKQIAENRETRN